MLIVGLAGLGYLARLNKADPEISTAVTSGRRIYVVLRRSDYVLAYNMTIRVISAVHTRTKYSVACSFLWLSCIHPTLLPMHRALNP